MKNLPLAVRISVWVIGVLFVICLGFTIDQKAHVQGKIEQLNTGRQTQTKVLEARNKQSKENCLLQVKEGFEDLCNFSVRTEEPTKEWTNRMNALTVIQQTPFILQFLYNSALPFLLIGILLAFGGIKILYQLWRKRYPKFREFTLAVLEKEKSKKWKYLLLINALILAALLVIIIILL